MKRKRIVLILIFIIMISGGCVENGINNDIDKKAEHKNIETEDMNTVVEKKTVMKGLELYIWKNSEITGSNEIYYTLLPGTNCRKSIDQIYDSEVYTSDIEIIKSQLSEYKKSSYLMIKNDLKLDKNIITGIVDELAIFVENGTVTAGGLDFEALEEEAERKRLIDIVEKNIEIIMSSPLESSNPEDYLRAHPDEVKEIVRLGSESKEIIDYLNIRKERKKKTLKDHIIDRILERIES